MARFDKTEPHIGTFRARLETDWLEADVGVVRGVGINTSGRAVKGAGNTGLKGVVALGKIRAARHPIDVMTSGEILDITDAEVTGTLAAGINIYCIPGTGLLTVTAATNVYVGHMVEIDRLVVRFGCFPEVSA